MTQNVVRSWCDACMEESGTRQEAYRYRIYGGLGWVMADLCLDHLEEVQTDHPRWHMELAAADASPAS